MPSHNSRRHLTSRWHNFCTLMTVCAQTIHTVTGYWRVRLCARWRIVVKWLNSLTRVGILMTFNAYIERKARVTVSVTRVNASGNPTPQTYTFLQHRMRINVRQGGNQFGNAKIEVFGVPLETMNNIARLWLESLTPQNTDTVAIDIWNGQDYVPFFSGVITWSAVNGGGMPAVSLMIEANAAMALMNDPASPYANAGPVSLQSALTAIAAAQQFSVDYSATASQYQLTDVRVTGSPMEQIAGLMAHFTDLTWFVNLQRLVVRNANAPFSADAINIAADNGLMRLPVYSSSGLQFDTLFNPQLRPGIACNVKTAFDFVNRTLWVAAVLSHTLEPNVPGGQWTTSCAANSYGPSGNNQT